jgi:hypothetical protein
MKQQELSNEKHIKDFMPLYEANEVCFRSLSNLKSAQRSCPQQSMASLLSLYADLIADLFPRRAEKINEASALRETLVICLLVSMTVRSQVQSHPAERERSRKKVLKSAKAQLDQSLEEERVCPILCFVPKTCMYACISLDLPQVATDATALIKHYEALLLS